MEKKQDIDIEKIKEKLRDESMSLEWNKERVWNTIAVNKEEPKVLFPFWRLAAVASLILTGTFGLWLFMGQNEDTQTAEFKTTEVATTVDTPVENEGLVKVSETNAIRIQKPKVSITKQITKIAAARQVIAEAKLEGLEFAKLVEPIKITAPIVETFEEMEIENVAAPKIEYTVNIENEDMKIKGQKMTLIIPEEEKMERRGVLGFIQKVGKFNQTGDWEAEEKDSKNTLWAKFIESTKIEKL